MAKVIKIGGEEEPEVTENELTQVPAPVEEPVAENVTTQEPVIDEEPITTELDDYKIKQKFVKKIYYSIILLIYLIFCYYLALDIMLNYVIIYYINGIFLLRLKKI